MASRLHRIALAIVLGLGAPCAGCIFFSDFDGLDSGSTASSSGGTGGGQTNSSDGGGACRTVMDPIQHEIARADESTPFKVDGDATDFCGLPFDTIDIRMAGRFRSICDAGVPSWMKMADPTATVHAAWTSKGLHFFFEVTKQTDFVTSVDAAYHADALEIFAALPGKNGTHLTFYPMTGGGENGGIPAAQERLVIGDHVYSLELFLTWNDLGESGYEPKIGDRIYFDFLVDSGDPNGDPTGNSQDRFSAGYCYDPPLDAGLDAVADTNCKDGQLGDHELAWCNVELVGHR